jgi:hypothetical protein
MVNPKHLTRIVFALLPSPESTIRDSSMVLAQFASLGFRGRLVCPRRPGKANYIAIHQTETRPHEPDTGRVNTDYFGERLRLRRTHPEDGIFEKAILQVAGKNPVAVSHVHVEHTVTSVGPNNR